MKFTTLHTVDTEYSADSIEWCPNPQYRNYFVCGTYQLEGDNAESTSPPCRRKGRIYLYKFDGSTRELKEVQRLETAAILDMKWLLRAEQEKPTLATANALGQIHVYMLEDDKLALRSSIDLNRECHNLLALSLDWDWELGDAATEGSTRRILASDSRGDISLLEFQAGGKLQKTRTWSAHSFEAWICAFDKWDKNRVYTGGDDSFMHVYDLRTYERVLINKSHIAGVTCLLSHPQRENVLLTGSYDERLRIFDTRTMKQPLGELNLGGGIWRLKSDPLERDLILAACMYQNFSVIELKECDLSNPKLVGVYNEHESICYGADWSQNMENNTEEMIVATCSFYDHKLCIASIKEDDSN